MFFQTYVQKWSLPWFHKCYSKASPTQAHTCTNGCTHTHIQNSDREDAVVFREMHALKCCPAFFACPSRLSAHSPYISHFIYFDFVLCIQYYHPHEEDTPQCGFLLRCPNKLQNSSPCKSVSRISTSALLSFFFFLFFPSVCISKSASKEGTVWTALVYRQLWETVCWYLCLWKTKAHLQHALRMNLPQSMNSFLNISPLKILMGTWKKTRIVTKKDAQERICSHHNIEKKQPFLSSDLT